MFTAALFIRAQHQKKFQKPIKWGMDKQHWHSNEKGTDTRYHMDTTRVSLRDTVLSEKMPDKR